MAAETPPKSNALATKAPSTAPAGRFPKASGGKGPGRPADKTAKPPGK